ncbi:MAG: TRL domain-containing protein [Nitrospirota bacterium]
MRNRQAHILLLSVLILFTPGCALTQYSSSSQGGPQTLTILGGIYSHTVQPLTINRESTDVRKDMKEGRGRVTQIDYPVTAGLSVRVGKNGLGQVAKEHGITTIYYADLEQWSALFGLWSMEIVHIYGQ